MRTTRLVAASTLFGAATVAAALDAGLLPAADRTVLVIQNNVPVPEVASSFDAQDVFGALRDRFDAVVTWNDVIAPYHPKAWRPQAADAPLWERYLRMLWDLGDDHLEIVAESLATSPTAAMVACFPGAPVTVYADGLMVYGPTRFELDHAVGGRIRSLLHLDLVPGLRPVLLTEWDVPSEVIPTEAFVKVVDQIAHHGTDSGDTSMTVAPGTEHALLLGQYMSAIGLVTPEEEAELHRSMVRAVVDRGFTHVVLKPHPSAPAEDAASLAAYAEELGAELTVAPMGTIAETRFTTAPPGIVVSCFSTALATATSLYGIPSVAVGTEILLERLEPYENSNRVPAMIVDALERGWAPGELQDLVESLAYCQRARQLDRLRPVAEKTLAGLDENLQRLWFRRTRLTALGLPGAFPVSPFRLKGVLRVASAVDRRTGGHLRRIAKTRYVSAGSDMRAALGALERRHG